MDIKKKYFKPQMECIEINVPCLLAGSTKPGGNTGTAPDYGDGGELNSLNDEDD